VYKLLGVEPEKKFSDDTVVERCVLMMLNEAAMCLQEEVIRNPRDGDIGAIFGIGFPPFLGGPFRYMDTLGLAHVVSRLEHYTETYSDKYQPAEILLTMHKEAKTFY
jgi:3-hydroxyacyl-CoA dehydrogenase/enoyl-CoA hydratase/3-hydroxybutyryl-CoA epimerase